MARKRETRNTERPTGVHRGRLELTWTNKHLRLLAHEEDSYEWVPPSDYRVAEVRLLRDAGTTGEVHSERRRAKDNLLIRGDSLHALTSLTSIPEFRDEYAGKVKLVYIDPPFNTQQMFAHYDDALEHSVWLTMMRDRLRLIKGLLTRDGSVWVHADDSEQHRLRCVLDEVFGPSNFKGTVVWQKYYSSKPNTDFATTHDYIHVYARDSQHFKVRRLPATTEQRARYTNPDADPRGPWLSVPFHVRTDNPERRVDYRYIVTLPSGREVEPPQGRHWNGKRPRFDAMLADGRLWFGQKGNSIPREKQFLSERELGIVPVSWWPREQSGDNDESKREIKALFPDVRDPFQTAKPERLLRRIIEAASTPGDLVLDCFVGSGTTAAVAHKMSRRWTAVEWSRETLETFTGPRLKKVVAGDDPGGITEAATWEGGGGFRVLDVAPSMFEEFEGRVLLAEWAVGSDLSEAVAAQFGYTYDAELLPFAGRKGRTLLAVVDGLANGAVAWLLVSELPEDGRLCLCATMLDPRVREELRALRPGSTVRKVPESILQDYRRGQLWWDRHAQASLEEAEAPAPEEAVPA